METSDEILIKCNDSYPIILPKSKIAGYIYVTKLTKDKIQCLMGIGAEYEEKIGGSKEKYEGYYLENKNN